MIDEQLQSALRKFDYGSAENDVRRRKQLPDTIRQTLLESTRSEWSKHPRYHGKAAFFMNLHREVLDGAAFLRQSVEAILDQPASELAEAKQLANLKQFAGRLISFAHHHHEIEDHGYFPQFLLLYPELDRGLALLDGDHRTLNSALDELDGAVKAINAARLDRDQIATLLKGSNDLEQILNRHIWDEEEVIIPIFLMHT